MMSRALTVAGRVVRHPSLLPEILRKVVHRMTTSKHRGHVEEYASLRISAPEALAQVLKLDEPQVRSAMESPSLLTLMRELEKEAERLPVHTHKLIGAAFMEACYAVTRLSRSAVVVETGVAMGFSTAAVLLALEERGTGVLHSVDLPAFRSGAEEYTGHIIPERLRQSGRWRLWIGPDRRVLPRLLRETGSVDLFFYDSDKSYTGMLRTWNLVWPLLRPGGILMADDIHLHDAFIDFCQSQHVIPTITYKPSGGGLYWGQRIYGVGLVRKPDAEAAP